MLSKAQLLLIVIYFQKNFGFFPIALSGYLSQISTSIWFKLSQTKVYRPTCILKVRFQLGLGNYLTFSSSMQMRSVLTLFVSWLLMQQDHANVIALQMQNHEGNSVLCKIHLRDYVKFKGFVLAGAPSDQTLI